MHIKKSESPENPIFVIYGDTLEEGKLAFMSTGSGTGFEIWEFVKPAFQKPDRDFEYARGGFYHIAVTDMEPGRLVEKVVAKGGGIVGGAFKMPGDGGYFCQYVRDPWGNVVEIMNRSFDRVAAMTEMAQAGQS